MKTNLFPKGKRVLVYNKEAVSAQLVQFNLTLNPAYGGI
jgi:hypothetical protein